MSFLDELNDEYEELLRQYPKGIASTSTTKYKAIRALFARALNIPLSEIYATGAMTRVSNLDTRLAQGNQRNRRTAVALAFLGGYDQTHDPGFERLRQSAIATCSKFIDGRERGTIFDDIVVFAEEDRHLAPVALLSVEESQNRAQLMKLLPNVKPIVRTRIDHPVADERLPFAPARAVAQERENVLGPELVDQCIRELRDANILCDTLWIRRYLAALLVRRFVILTGLSGSGKTRLAMAVASWLAPSDEHVRVVAVGADWTTSEHLLGYPDALDKTSYSRPASGVLELLLRASGDPDNPYFLILDEMNLSHVERYFADILSAMESGEPIRLHGSREPLDHVPRQLTFPSNLFVVGTVNVDETTYLFSPKVLDRANVLEFRIQGEDLSAYLENPRRPDMRRIAAAGAKWAGSFVAAANENDFTPDASGAEDVRTVIRELFDEFATHDLEFGYRTAFDMCRFVGVFQKLSAPDSQVDDALDSQIVQKLLPKLHGSERRLRPILEKLKNYCLTRNFADSKDKIARMLNRLDADGFTSFTEA